MIGITEEEIVLEEPEDIRVLRFQLEAIWRSISSWFESVKKSVESAFWGAIEDFRRRLEWVYNEVQKRLKPITDALANVIKQFQKAVAKLGKLIGLYREASNRAISVGHKLMHLEKKAREVATLYAKAVELAKRKGVLRKYKLKLDKIREEYNSIVRDLKRIESEYKTRVEKLRAIGKGIKDAEIKLRYARSQIESEREKVRAMVEETATKLKTEAEKGVREIIRGGRPSLPPQLLRFEFEIRLPDLTPILMFISPALAFVVMFLNWIKEIDRDVSDHEARITKIELDLSALIKELGLEKVIPPPVPEVELPKPAEIPEEGVSIEPPEVPEVPEITTPEVPEPEEAKIPEITIPEIEFVDIGIGAEEEREYVPPERVKTPEIAEAEERKRKEMEQWLLFVVLLAGGGLAGYILSRVR